MMMMVVRIKAECIHYVVANKSLCRRIGPNSIQLAQLMQLKTEIFYTTFYKVKSNGKL